MSFRVGDDVYDAEFVNVMRAFYHWRSGHRHQPRLCWAPLPARCRSSGSVCPAALRAVPFQRPRETDFELCVDDIAFTSAARSDASTWVASGGGGCTLARRPAAPGLVAIPLLSGLGFALGRRRAS
ncbi:MAG TPA: hypothetical protein VI197_04330 [Polyangiaceae bacterium]